MVVKKRRKRPNKGTKAREKWELRNLKKKCSRAWSIRVRNLADNKCVLCESEALLHSHHLEDSRLCTSLRYDTRNGVCVCAKHHKYCNEAAHKSFSTIFRYMVNNRLDDIHYLESHRNDKVEWTTELLLKKIGELQNGKDAKSR